MRRAVLSGVLVLLLLPATAPAWSWPTSGDVLRPYSYTGDPYAGGQHRGMDVAGQDGSNVAAPAGGAVVFVGSVANNGKTVAIETADGYTVTLTHLGSIAVRKGDTVREGAVVGTVGVTGQPEVEGPYVHLGVRRAEDPNGYVDPASLLPVLASPPVAPPPPAIQPAPVVPPAPHAAPPPPATQPPAPEPTLTVPEPAASETPEAAVPPSAAPAPEGLAAVATEVTAPAATVITRPLSTHAAVDDVAVARPASEGVGAPRDRVESRYGPRAHPVTASKESDKAGLPMHSELTPARAARPRSSTAAARDVPADVTRPGVQSRVVERDAGALDQARNLGGRRSGPALDRAGARPGSTRSRPRRCGARPQATPGAREAATYDDRRCATTSRPRSTT